MYLFFFFFLIVDPVKNFKGSNYSIFSINWERILRVIRFESNYINKKVSGVYHLYVTYFPLCPYSLPKNMLCIFFDDCSVIRNAGFCRKWKVMLDGWMEVALYTSTLCRSFVLKELPVCLWWFWAFPGQFLPTSWHVSISVGAL